MGKGKAVKGQRKETWGKANVLSVVQFFQLWQGEVMGTSDFFV